MFTRTFALLLYHSFTVFIFCVYPYLLRITSLLETINLLIFCVFVFTPVRFWLEQCSDVKANFNFFSLRSIEFQWPFHIGVYTQRVTNQEWDFEHIVKFRLRVCVCVCFVSYLITGSRYNQSSLSFEISSFFIHSFHFRSALRQLIILSMIVSWANTWSSNQKSKPQMKHIRTHVHCKLHSKKLSSAIYIFYGFVLVLASFRENKSFETESRRKV